MNSDSDLLDPPTEPLIESRRERLFRRLANLQHDHPWRFVAVAVLIVLGSVPLMLRLGVKGNFTALLPENKPSVVDFDVFAERLGVASTLSVNVWGDDLAEVKALTRALAESLERDPPPGLRFIDWNLAPLNAFVERNKYLYAPYDDMKKVRDAIRDRIDFEKAKAIPGFIDLGEEPEDPMEIIDKLRKREKEFNTVLGRFPDGFLQHPKLPLVVMLIRTDIVGGDLPRAEAMISEVERRAAALRPDMVARGLHLELGGDLMDVLVEVKSLQKEIALATTATVLLVLLSVYAFFLNMRAIPLLGLVLVPPVLATFGIAELAVDDLNTSTAFLGSIVIGNGINSNILWLSRFFECRRAGMSVRQALHETHVHAWGGTLTAAAAAALSYGSLISTDFRGFREFGIIGGTGMAFCWLGAYLLLPALATIAERYRPLKPRPESAHQNVYGTVFAWLGLRSPRTVVLATIAISVVSAAVVASYIVNDPMEYDFRRLQSVPDPDSRVTWVRDRTGETVSVTLTGSAIAVLTETREQARAIQSDLERRRAEFGGVYDDVVTLDLLVPERQPEKIAMLNEIRAMVVELRPHLKESEWAEVEQNLPPTDLVPLQQGDLPPEATRMFTEIDGQQGRVVYAEPPTERNTWDGLFLLDWATSVRTVAAAGGRTPHVAGIAPVFADLIDSVMLDGPRAVAVALLVTMVLVVLAFRQMRERLLTLGSLVIGVLWMTAAMALVGIRLNFLNFVSFPITFGISVDYAVNVMKRTVEETERLGDRALAVRRAIEATGGAVILCSLTTIIGYISLFVSSNQALNSFGAAMAISEVMCLGAAVILLPAYITWRAQRSGAVQSSVVAERVR